MLELQNISYLVDDDNKEILRDINLAFDEKFVAITGPNGSGKSTLLEAIAIAHGFNPEGGTKNYVFSTHDTHSELCDAIRVVKGYRKNGDIFLEQKVSIMLQRRKKNMVE